MEMEATVRDLTPKLLRYCAGRLGDADLAADVAQDALVALVARWRRHGPPESPAGFVFAIARRRAFRAALRRRLLQPLEAWRDDGDAPTADGGCPERRAEHRQAVRRAAASVGRLPTAERETLLLVVAAGLTTAEAAAALGIGASAVKMRLSRARRRLRRQRERQDFPEGSTEQVPT